MTSDVHDDSLSALLAEEERQVDAAVIDTRRALAGRRRGVQYIRLEVVVLEERAMRECRTERVFRRLASMHESLVEVARGGAGGS